MICQVPVRLQFSCPAIENKDGAHGRPFVRSSPWCVLPGFFNGIYTVPVFRCKFVATSRERQRVAIDFGHFGSGDNAKKDPRVAGLFSCQVLLRSGDRCQDDFHAPVERAAFCSVVTGNRVRFTHAAADDSCGQHTL